MKTNLPLSNKHLFNVLIACAVILCFGSQAQAASIDFDFPLNASQQVPTNASTGSGDCFLSLDDVSGSVSVSCSFSGLSSAAVAAHIHGLAGPGINAGVILALTATAATGGTITGNGILDAAQMAGMINGQTYVNLHTGQYPGGEIRGQVTGVHKSIPTLSNSLLIVLIVVLLMAGVFTLRRRFV